MGSQKYENKRMIKMLIISKCQSFFEVEKTQKVVTAKELLEINSCKDLVIYSSILIDNNFY